MKLNIGKKAENVFFNPDFIKERTLTLSFDGGKIFRPMEYDLLAIVGKAVPYAFAVAATLQYSSGNIRTGIFLSIIPTIDILTKSEAIRTLSGELTARFQDNHPDEVKRRAIGAAISSKQDQEITNYQEPIISSIRQKNTLTLSSPV